MAPIRVIVAALLRALLPSSGRHRSSSGAARMPAERRPVGPATRSTARAAGPVLRAGEDVGPRVIHGVRVAG